MAGGEEPYGVSVRTYKCEDDFIQLERLDLLSLGILRL